MKTRRISIDAVLLNGFILWFGTYAYLYLYSVTGFKPLYSYFLFLGFVSFRLLIVRRMSIPVNRGVQELLVWVAAFIYYTILNFLISSKSDTATQMLITWLESALLLIGFVLLFSLRRSLKDIQIMFAVIALFGVAMNFYDFFQPTFSNVPGRAAGFYENPNIAGKFIAFSMTAAIPVTPRKLRVWFVMLCGFGILVTFSRNSWLLWGTGVFFLGWAGELVVTRHRMIAVFVTGIISVGALTLLFTGSLGQMVTGSPLAEYLDPNTTARLGIGGAQAQFEDSSANERALLAITALEQGAQHPLFGNGLAYTREAGGWEQRVSTHNVYLLFWAEGGLFGLALFIWFIFLLWRHSAGAGRALAVQIMIVSFFTHNTLDQPGALIFPAFVIAHGYLARRQKIVMTGQKQMAVPT